MKPLKRGFAVEEPRLVAKVAAVDVFPAVASFVIVSIDPTDTFGPILGTTCPLWKMVKDH